MRKTHPDLKRTVLAGVAVLSVSFPYVSRAQDNYEIQVYGADTVPAGRTMIELHSNFSVDGEREVINGVVPSEHAFHESLEVTHGFTPWFETGFYLFTSVQPGARWNWVGDHVRPRIRVPDDWHWPLGVSLSTELGYQRRSFSEDTWNWELRPILDKQWGRWYVAFNPALEKSIEGLNSSRGFSLAPSAKLSFAFTKVFAAGVEYYSSLGPLGNLDTWQNQQNQIFPAIDLSLSPRFEFNFGVGIGLTRSTDGLLVKLILGYTF